MREPKHLGTGIYVHDQYFPELVIGDTFSDADFGNVIWNGDTWVDNHIDSTYDKDINHFLNN